MYQTTIRLQLDQTDYRDENALFAGFAPFVSAAFVDAVEISDLTIDCNLQNQPDGTNGKYPLLVLAALQLFGSNIKIRRVRVINFGTRTPSQINGADVSANSGECFPIAIGGLVGTQPSYNVQIDRCVIEQPYISNARETTCTLLQIGTDRGRDLPTRNEGTRRCYLNLEYTNLTPAPATHVSKITYTPGSAIVTFETDYPHNMLYHGPYLDWVEISGANNLNYNGRVRVSAAVTPPDGSSRLLQVTYASDPGAPTDGYVTLQESLPRTMRAWITYSAVTGVYTVHTTEKHNRRPPAPPAMAVDDDWVVITGANEPGYNGSFEVASVPDRYSFTIAMTSVPPPTTDSTGDLWLDRRSNQYVPLNGITPTGGNEIEVTTFTPHLRKPNEYATVFGVTVGQSPANLYNSYFKIKSTPSPLKFRVDLSGVPPSNPDWSAAYIGSNFQATSADSGYGSTMEKNLLINCRKGGTYHDTWTSDECICRRNYYYNVFDGPLEVLNPHDYTATVMSQSAGIVTIEVTPADTNPGLFVGEQIHVVTTSGTIFTEVVTVSTFFFNAVTNSWRITFSSALTYSMGQTLNFNEFFQVRRMLLFDENLIDLVRLDYITNSAPGGIFLGGHYTLNPLTGQTNPWTYKQVIVRGNLIRKTGDASDSANYGSNTAIDVDSAENAIIENNIIGKLQPSYQYQWLFRYSNCGTIKAFNNQDNAGNLLQLWNDGGPGHFVNNDAGFFSDLQNQFDDIFLNLQPRRRRMRIWP